MVTQLAPPTSRGADPDAGPARPPLIKANIAWITIQWVLAAWAVQRIWDHGTSIPATVWWTAAVSYIVIGFGVTVGYHRGFTHGGFLMSRPMKAWLLFAGGCAVEGPLPRWLATHKAHHAYNDIAGRDPHTPLQFARREPLAKQPLHRWQLWSHLRQCEIVVQIKPDRYYMTYGEWLRGAWHSHYGWALRDRPLPEPFTHYAPADRLEAIQARYYPVNIALGFLIPWAITGFTLDGFLIACALRAFLLFNSTAAINSVCHLFGTQLADAKAQARARHSRNVWWLWPVSLGEAWHNTHHALAGCVAHGWRWWQFDPSKYLIWGLERVRLVRQVKWLRRERRKILAYRPEPPAPAPATQVV